MLVAAGLAALQTPVAAALATAAGLGLTGLVFTAVAGVTAQLTGNARPATGLAAAALGAAYLLRAVGDSSGHGVLSWLSWISPIGWAQQTGPYAGERWGVLVVPVVVAAVLGTAAVGLEGPRLRRQPAASPPRSGPGAGAAGQPDRTGLAAGARGFRGLGRRFRAVRRGDRRGGQRRTRPFSGRRAEADAAADGRRAEPDRRLLCHDHVADGHGGHHPRGAVDAAVARRGNGIARRASARHHSE